MIEYLSSSNSSSNSNLQEETERVLIIPLSVYEDSTKVDLLSEEEVLNMNIISSTSDNHSVASSLELEDNNDNDNLSDMNSLMTWSVQMYLAEEL